MFFKFSHVEWKKTTLFRALYCLFCLAVLFLASCNKEDTSLEQQVSGQETEIQPSFEFSKRLVITDGQGNEATVEVFANTLQALEDHTENSFRLFTTTKDFSNLVNEGTTGMVTGEVDNWETDADNLVYIEVVNYKLVKGITGFSVRVVENPSGISSRGWNYAYEYGANGVRGLLAQYTRESCSKEYLKVKLSKKDNCNGWFWNRLADGKLKSQGDEWIYWSSTIYCKYRFGWKWKKSCNGVRIITFVWLT